MTIKTDPAVVTATRIAAGDDRTVYDGLSIALHWLTALLVVTQFALAELWEHFARPTRHAMIVAHMSFGIILTAVILARIAWRLTPGHEVRSAVSGLVEKASTGVHYLLYGLLVVQAALGFILRWSGGEAMSFFGIQIPPPIGQLSRPHHHLVGEAHEWVGWAIIIIAAGHALAALYHHYVLKDGLLLRMTPHGSTRRSAV